MLVELAPHSLTWDEVDPARHPFDVESVSRVVRSLGPARKVPGDPDVPEDRTAAAGDPTAEDDGFGNRPQRWADAMSQALVEHYGRWTVGWRWGHDESDFGGGPVGNWRTASASITTPEETLDRVVAALCEWRAWLESLAGRFRAYPLTVAGVADQRILWERAARNLILQVVDRTDCGGGWHKHCRQVLTWFLSCWGIAPDRARDLVEQTIGGRFESWIGPDPVLVDDVAESFARALRPADGARSAASARPTGPPPDHLERWLTVRAGVAWQDVPDGGGDGPVTPSCDGAADDIRAFDGALDIGRAEGMLTALELARADAARGAPLDFALLQGWQRHILGTPEPPPFRQLPAFAKGGRERYGIGPDTPARLDACLAESARPAGRPLPLTARAARSYLDVCFFHPFGDGNARSAFLTLVFVLAREGIALDAVFLLRRVTFQADEPEDALTLAGCIDCHLTETRRTAVSPS
ncbi:Fic family protein [Streptomyces brasiliscabiei]|uniref:Fic family protein n=1 Tax=Streptomyces brasiliscabiei TaxID=2736302 RepID=A0ABU8GPZ7_9ACTN